MTSSGRTIRNVERLHIALAVVACGVSALFGRQALIGAIVGVAIGGVNFRVGAFLTRRFTEGTGRSKSAAVFLLVGKLALLALALGAAMRLLHPNPISLLVALSLAPLSTMIVTALGQRPAGSADGGVSAEPRSDGRAPEVSR